MLNDDTLIKVTNRNRGYTGYTIPEMNNLRREFAPSESKKIPYAELRQLSWIPGGLELINSCLVLDNTEAVQEILGQVEPEYYYSAEDVKKLLIHGSLAQLQDCMDFAPQGVLDLIKQYSVELEINDVRKREAILNKLGFDVTTAIMTNKIKEEAEAAPEEHKARRSTPITETETTSTESDAPVRRATAPKYKVTAITK